MDVVILRYQLYQNKIESRIASHEYMHRCKSQIFINDTIPPDDNEISIRGIDSGLLYQNTVNHSEL